MLNSFLNMVNIVVGLLIVALVIAYATIIIPIALVSFAGFVLLLWLVLHAVDGISIWSYRIKKRFFSKRH